VQNKPVSTETHAIREVYSLINRKITEKRNASWSEYCSTNNIKINQVPPSKLTQYDHNRHLDRIYTRLKLNNTLLKGHSFTNEKNCIECNQSETIDHMFIQCKRHIIPRKELEATIQKLGFTVMDLTTLLDPPNTNAEQKRTAVFQYIKDINYTNKI
jgi:hypothetical protein